MSVSVAVRDIRGAYTHEDVNRVLFAMEQINGWLSDLGYDRTVYQTDPQESYEPVDTMRLMDVKRYLQNVEALRSALTVPEGTPEPLAEPKDVLTIQGANDIERILAAVDHLRPLLEQSWWYSGEIYCGEDSI